MKRAGSVQDFIPLKNISHGIIETTDGRYLKINEIEPINFMLRSAEEQIGIISSFASWLKIAPVSLQFKSVTRKADTDKHVAAIEEELSKEKNLQCRELGNDYIKLIKDVGNRDALTRRFFLIFKYEEAVRSDDFKSVYSALMKAEQNARAYFLQCGNSIIEPESPDEYVAEILYMYFNRKTAAEKPFMNRVEEVIARTMAARGKVVGIDAIPDIPIVNFIAPDSIDFTHSRYFVMDGRYFSVIYVKANGYPKAVRAGWMSGLINAGEGIDVDVHLRKENRGKTVDKVSQRIRLNRTKIKGMQDTNTDFEELSNSIQAGYYIKQSMANNNEDLYYMSVFITVSADSLEELNWRKQQLTDMLKSSDINVSECKYQQESAFKTVMPFLYTDKSLNLKSRRNVLTSGAASTYIFTSFELSDDSGVLLGVNKFNSSLCIIDLFNTKKNKNANLNIIGTSGAGKTFTMQLLALRMRMRGIQCFTIAPIKGHEFKRACESIGGSYIKIAPGSEQCINVMEIRNTVLQEDNFLADYSANDSVLAAKIQQLMIFFSLLIPDMTNEEEQMLDEAIIKTYSDFGITHSNKSLYANAGGRTLRLMPTLGDLHKNLKENNGTYRLAIIISRFVTGSAQSFNRQTNVDLTNKYIVLDLSELNGKLLPVGMMIALDFVWDKIKADRTKKKAVFIDEIWQLVGASSNKLAAEFCLTIFKTIRGYGGAAIAATQDLTDFFGLDDGKYGRAIINNSQNKIILNLEPDEAKYVKDVLNLSRTEIRSVIGFERGEALICSNNNKVPVQIRASKTEHDLITTDRTELEMLKKNEVK